MLRLLLPFLLLCMRVQAQRLSFNAQAGVANSQIFGDSLHGHRRWGPQASLGLSRELIQRLGLRAELAYATKGSIRRDQPSVEYRKLPYLSLRVLGQFDLTPHLAFMAGLAPGLLMRYYESTINSKSWGNVTEFDDLDLCYHLGLDYWLGGNASLHLHYERSALPATRPEYRVMRNETLALGLRIFLFEQTPSADRSSPRPQTPRYLQPDELPE